MVGADVPQVARARAGDGGRAPDGVVTRRELALGFVAMLLMAAMFYALSVVVLLVCRG